MLIAQITDCHLTEKTAPRERSIDVGADLSRAVDAVNALHPLPDLVILTGDMVDTCAEAEYAHLFERLALLHPPVFLIPGNHDAREPLRKIMTGFRFGGDSGFMHFVHDTEDEHGPLRLLFLDTLDDGRTGGIQCAERLDWLKDRLEEAPDVPTLIAMHHPPVTLGIPAFDDFGFPGMDAFQALIKEAPQVDLILCGHIHRTTSAQLGGARVHIGPSSSFNYHLELRPDVPFRPPLHDPAYSLHKRVSPRHWVSHALPSMP